jgi:predicted dehydrogenase
MVSEALANGKHMFCEIPLTSDINESNQLIKIANESRVILMPDLTFRFTPNYAKAKELIDASAIGTPISLNFCELIPAKDLATQRPSDSWARNTKKSSGRPDFSLSILSLDLARWLFDSEIIGAKWMSNHVPLPALNNCTVHNTAVVIRLSNDAIGTLHYSASILTQEGTARLEIFGNNTSVLRATWNDHISLVDEKFRTEWTFKMRGTRVWGHYQIDSHFIDCILQGKKPLATVEDAIKAQIIAEKINQ